MVFFFHVQISHVLGFISVTYLLTLPHFYVIRNRPTCRQIEMKNVDAPLHQARHNHNAHVGTHVQQ
jgi:hypothetical protein